MQDGGKQSAPSTQTCSEAFEAYLSWAEQPVFARRAVMAFLQQCYEVSEPIRNVAQAMLLPKLPEDQLMLTKGKWRGLSICESGCEDEKCRQNAAACTALLCLIAERSEVSHRHIPSVLRTLIQARGVGKLNWNDRLHLDEGREYLAKIAGAFKAATALLLVAHKP
jgi:hypothetical protein